MESVPSRRIAKKNSKHHLLQRFKQSITQENAAQSLGFSVSGFGGLEYDSVCWILFKLGILWLG